MNLNDLSPEAQDTIIAWLDQHPTREVVDLVGAPPPDGFGLKTHITSLRRFRARHKLQQRPEEATLAREILQRPPEECAAFDGAAAAAIRQLAFEIATSPRNGSKQFKAISRWVLKLREYDMETQRLALARERLALEEKKFQFNAARQALNHLVDLQPILRNTSIDDEDKIRAARDRLFGPPQSPAPDQGSGSPAKPDRHEESGK